MVCGLQDYDIKGFKIMQEIILVVSDLAGVTGNN